MEKIKKSLRRTVIVHACNPIAWVVELLGRSDAQGYLQLHRQQACGQSGLCETVTREKKKQDKKELTSIWGEEERGKEREVGAQSRKRSG